MIVITKAQLEALLKAQSVSKSTGGAAAITLSNA